MTVIHPITIHDPSNPIRVAVIGAGTIGKRLAEAIRLQPDMALAGVAIRGSNRFADAQRDTIGFYCSDRDGTFGDLPIKGTLEDLLERCDIVADCGPRGTAAARMKLYAEYARPVLLQGGEDSSNAEISYCSAYGAEQARGATSVRVVSCNTTALVRFVAALAPLSQLSRLRLVLVRCAADPDKAAKGHVSALVADAGQSHHAEDLRLFWPALDVASLGLKAPTNRGHMVLGFVQLSDAVALEDIRAALSNRPRISLLEGSPGTEHLRSRLGQGHRKDCYDVLVWDHGLVLSDRELSFSLSLHMESIVIPDTLDALRLMGRPGLSVNEACATTDTALRRNAQTERFDTCLL